MAARAQIFQSLLAGLYYDGDVLNGGTVEFLNPGLLTQKAVYLDRNKTTEAENPYELNANGQAELFGDGVYDVVIRKSNGNQVDKWESVALADVLSGQGGLSVIQYGATGDGSTDDTAAIQAAIDAAAATASPYNGSVVRLPSGIYIVDGITMKTRVMLVGEGIGTTIIKLKSGANADVITIPSGSSYNGLYDLTINGNKDNNTSGSGITWATNPVTDGGQRELFTKGTHLVGGVEKYSYKYCFLERVAFSNCAEHGIDHPASNFVVWGNTVFCTFNGVDGLHEDGYNSHYINLMAEANGRCGLYSGATSANNRFINAEINWNGYDDDTLGQVYDAGSRNFFSIIHAEDGWTHGFYIGGKQSVFSECISDRNGYDKDTGTGEFSPQASSRAHSGFYINSNNINDLIGCKVVSYTGVLADGFYATEYPYTIAGGVRFNGRFEISYDPSRVNSAPVGTYEQIVGNRYKGTYNSNMRLVADSDQFTSVRFYAADTNTAQLKFNADTGKISFDIPENLGFRAALDAASDWMTLDIINNQLRLPSTDFIVGDKANGTYKGNLRTRNNDQFPSIGFYSAEILKAQIIADADSGRVNIDAPGDLYVRTAVNGGTTMIQVKAATSRVSIGGIVEYADKATASAAGLVAGDLYRTGDVLKVMF